ncbi:argininosuccinate lyase [Clostridium frigidicarnis]|uniref:Argininosuccinate lyase n=1 Tax=Clostridium frigidicarnis TaxID=84698 RepID=A0A1I0W5S8_9CLOT|nr:argininosuccinate lyase [Clostridium frigidicarnis]SFA83901.1 argininosuccinate lyase [Clostridium frigidicarnis]
MKLWGGRFKKGESKLMEDFNSSLSFDKRLYLEDINGSIVHVNMLKNCNIISEDEGKEIECALRELLKDIEENKIEIKGNYEDIHSFVEINLIERIGNVAKKLHTARSRNDQVALDMRLYSKECAINIKNNLEKLGNTLKCVGENNPYIMPGYTHLQRAQVVTFTHHMKAYEAMFKRDIKRIENAIEILDECPLGCCALAGTTYNIDREFTAKELGFKKPTDNFLDGVSDRDYLIELSADFSIIMMHLSRLSEELILWSSKEFDFISIDDEFATGSSIMPQKKNPDGPELIRGKSGRVYGTLISLLTTMKSLPLAYNKDMQEDKEVFFDALDTTSKCLIVMERIIGTMKVKNESMRNAVKAGFLNATEVADYLVCNGMAFRDAHKVVGEIILFCEEKGVNIEKLTLDELKQFSSCFTEDIYDFIDYEVSITKGIKNNMNM